MGAVILVDVDRRIIVEGVYVLHGANYRVVPDRIEIASFAAAAVATGGDVTVKGARQDHLADPEQLREALIPAAEATPPMTLQFEPPMRFMQSKVVVLPLDPNGPVRALHERIVASIRSGVVTTDLDGRIFTFNVAAQEITGYQEETIRGKDASILFGELKEHIPETLRALEKGKNSPRFEANCLTSEGMRLRLGYSISPLSSEAGETTGMVITFQDLTQVRSLEETSRRQDRLAAIGRMAASIAHEIRNPLAAMRG